MSRKVKPHATRLDNTALENKNRAEMPKLLERCREEFGTDNLYEVLCIKKTANDRRGGYKTAIGKVTRFRYIINGCET